MPAFENRIETSVVDFRGGLQSLPKNKIVPLPEFDHIKDDNALLRDAVAQSSEVPTGQQTARFQKSARKKKVKKPKLPRRPTNSLDLTLNHRSKV